MSVTAKSRRAGRQAKEKAAEPLKFLVDQNVPRVVADYLRGKGYETLLVREALTEDAEDPVIAKYASNIQAVVVTWNARDFVRLIARAPRGENNRFRRAGLLCFECPEPRGLQRLLQLFPLIQAEHALLQVMSDRRLFVTVHSDRVVLTR